MTTPQSLQSPLTQFIAHSSTETPRPVFDGKRWHCFGQGVGELGKWEIYHSSSLFATGPWTGHAPIYLDIVGTSDNVPGVIYENGAFNLFVGSMPNGVHVIEYFLSIDLNHWYHVDTVLSAKDGDEIALCDPFPIVVNDTYYLLYSDASDGSRHTAKSRSDTWSGPYSRLGKLPTSPAIH